MTLEQHGFQPPGATHTQIFFNSKYTTVLHNLWLVGSIDAELWTLRPNCKDFPLHSGVSTPNPRVVQGSTVLSPEDTLMSTEMIQRTSVILLRNQTTNLF